MRTQPETRARSAQEAGKRALNLGASKANQACTTTGQVSIKKALALEHSAALEVAPTDCDYDSDSAESWEHELGREMTESNDLVHRGGRASIKTSLALEPLAPLEVAPFTACGEWGASGGGLGGGASVVSDVSSVGVKRRANADSDIVGPRTKIRAGVAYVTASVTAGAIVAPSRTGEGRGLPCGNQRTCLVDAAFNAALTLDPTSTISLAKLRTAAIPKLGNVLEASWGSVDGALAAQNAPFRLKESTATFHRTKGGLMLNILNAPAGVYVATTLVTVCGKPNRHAICVSTLPEAHFPLGKMIDDASTMKPVYIEEADKQHKRGARCAFKQLFAQRVGHDDFCVEMQEIFQLVAA